MQPTNQYRQVRLEKLEKLKAMGVEVWPAKAKRTHGLAQVEQRLLASSPPYHRRPPFLSKFRHRPEHVADVQAMVARSVA